MSVNKLVKCFLGELESICSFEHKVIVCHPNHILGCSKGVKITYVPKNTYKLLMKIFKKKCSSCHYEFEAITLCRSCYNTVCDSCSNKLSQCSVCHTAIDYNGVSQFLEYFVINFQPLY